MGLQIGEIVPKEEITIDFLKDKIIVVDGFNAIYQFLSNIRQPDGTPLMDSKKRITSHLSGLFYRTTNLMSRGVKFVYVFDGKKSELKQKTIEMREKRKDEAREKYETAKEEGKEEEMYKYSRQNIRLNEEMIEESKELLQNLGIPVIQAPEEGEAQASYMAKHDARIYAVASQDYDSLLFGAPRLIQNLTLAKKRTLASGNTVTIQPELIELERVLNHLNINYEQLICLGILVGTDFNPGGIKGIGQKKALSLVSVEKAPVLIFNYLAKLAEQGKFPYPDFKWEDIFTIFKTPNVTKDYEIEFKKINKEKIKKLLCEEHEFNEERVSNALEKVEEFEKTKEQKTIKDFF